MKTTRRKKSTRKKAARKKSSRKQVGRKKTARKAAGRKKKPVVVPANVRRVSFDEWLGMAREKATTAEAAGEPRGACLLPDPAGGPSMCAYLDRATCTALKGSWVGGPC